MKSATDPRHQKRLHIVQQLFAHSFSDTTPLSNDAEIRAIIHSYAEMDKKIEKAAPQFPIDKIAKIDVAILHLAVYELIYDQKEPPKVIIDEAVELAKELGGEGSPSFVNGVLGTLLKERMDQKEVSDAKSGTAE